MNNKNNHHNKTISSTQHKGSNGSAGQACAACKYQRRKCAPDCILAPYFPHDRQRQFLNAHKLFGVSNITKIIRKLDQPQRDEAMRTIIFQSDVRAHDPVGGCCRVIRELQRQIEFCQAELNIVLHRLALCRAQSQNDNQIQINNFNDQDPSMLDYSRNECDNQERVGTHDDDEGFDIFGQMIVPLQENDDSWGMENSGSGSLEVKQHSSSVQNECEEIKQLLLNDLDITTDVQRSFRFEFEETVQPPCSSDENDFRDQTSPNKQDHDLKGAATLFSLTNCSSY